MLVLKEFEHLVKTKICSLKTISSIIFLEARLARLSIIPLLFTICFLIITFASFWLILITLLGYVIFIFSQNFILSISIVLILNIVMLLGLIKYCSMNFKKISFTKTREYFN